VNKFQHNMINTKSIKVNSYTIFTHNKRQHNKRLLQEQENIYEI